MTTIRGSVNKKKSITEAKELPTTKDKALIDNSSSRIEYM